MTGPVIPYFTRFLPDAERGGGCHRLLQLLEIFSDFEISLISSVEADRLPQSVTRRLDRHGRKLAWWQPWFWRHRLNRWAPGHRTNVFRLGEISRGWSALYRDAVPPLAFLDDPVYFAPLFHSLDERSVPVAAFCHNLESLAPEQVRSRAASGLLKKETGLLARCRLVITISREETWLLRNLGIDACYLPYYPCRAIVQNMLRIREARKERSRSHFLLLGSACNLQSRAGMQALVRYWDGQKLNEAAGPLLIAGQQTEKSFPPGLQPEGIRVRGTLSSEDLHRLLEEVRACIIYQESGAGALTRIPELLLAGIPVLANAHAARSFHHQPGVTEFQELDQLKELVSSPSAGWEAEPPPPEPPDCSGILLKIREILRESRLKRPAIRKTVRTECSKPANRDGTLREGQPLRIAHVINPAAVPPSSDLYAAQPVTFRSMAAAREFTGGDADVSLYAVQNRGEPVLPLPEGFVRLPDLTRTVAGAGRFAVSRPLPLLADILDRAYQAAEGAGYIVYTNADIALQPFFYSTIGRLIRQGHDAFVINRRTIPGQSAGLEALPLLYAATGDSHPGHDCFVFRRELYPAFRLGRVAVGVRLVGRVLLWNMLAAAENFEEYKNLHLTFHLGNRQSWKDQRFQDYDRFNEREAMQVLMYLEKKYLFLRLVQTRYPEYLSGIDLKKFR